MQKHWSKVEYLHQSVKNPNIIVKGTKSYYSNAWTENFEDYVVRYLYGDATAYNTGNRNGRSTNFTSATASVSGPKPLS